MREHGRAKYIREGCRCETCKTAASQYHQKMREKHPDLLHRGIEANKARDAALRRLAKMYPNVVVRLTNEERSKRGLPLLGEVPPGRPKQAAS